MTLQLPVLRLATNVSNTTIEYMLVLVVLLVLLVLQVLGEDSILFHFESDQSTY